MDFVKVGEVEVHTYESTLHRANGGKIPMEVYARRIDFESTEAIQWTIHDLTERKELDALRDDLASMIYHDLRSPLGNIVGSLNMLASMVDDDAGARSLL